MGSTSMNLYEGTVSRSAAGATVSLGSQQLVSSAEFGRGLPNLFGSSGRKLVIGIRPEHLTIPAGEDAAPTSGR